MTYPNLKQNLPRWTLLSAGPACVGPACSRGLSDVGVQGWAIQMGSQVWVTLFHQARLS